MEPISPFTSNQKSAVRFQNSSRRSQRWRNALWSDFKNLLENSSMLPLSFHADKGSSLLSIEPSKWQKRYGQNHSNFTPNPSRLEDSGPGSSKSSNSSLTTPCKLPALHPIYRCLWPPNWWCYHPRPPPIAILDMLIQMTIRYKAIPPNSGKSKGRSFDQQPGTSRIVTGLAHLGTSISWTSTLASFAITYQQCPGLSREAQAHPSQQANYCNSLHYGNKQCKPHCSCYCM